MPESIEDKLSKTNISLSPVPLQYRFANFIIDAILINILASGINMVYPFLPAENEIKEMMLNNNISVFFNFAKVQFIASLAINILYYFPLEFYGKATFGKLITNTRVVSADGNIGNSKQILIRTLCRSIPFDGISFLFTNGVGWHDTISKTRVVSKLQLESITNN